MSCLALATILGLEAQPKNSRVSVDRLLEVDNLSINEAAVFLDRFRSLRLSSDYVFDFDLKHFPARGQSQVFSGRMFGTWEQGLPVQRIEFLEKNKLPNIDALLFRTGVDTAFYNAQSAFGSWSRVSASELFKPVEDDLGITPFELQMPFIFWEDWELHGITRVLGRPAYVFDMIAPESLMADYPDLERIRLSLDADFYALLRADFIDASGSELRSIRVVSFKKVGDDWIPKAIDYVSPGSREKARFIVRAAALGVILSKDVFDHELMRSQVDVSTVAFELLKPENG